VTIKITIAEGKDNDLASNAPPNQQEETSFSSPFCKSSVFYFGSALRYVAYTPSVSYLCMRYAK
jgi:hypothetical protein